MTKADSLRLPRPTTDERRLWDIIGGVLGGQGFLVALDLKLFPWLAERPATIEEVADQFRLDRRAAETLLILCTTLGALERRGERFEVTQLTCDYLLPNSPVYFGGFMEGSLAQQSTLTSFESVRKAFVENRSQIYDGDTLFESHELDDEAVRGFTTIMHWHSMAPALAWPELFDLSEIRRMIDVGGGSGAHTIAAALRWPDLEGVIFEMPKVCTVAREFIDSYGVQGRVTTETGDLWHDPLPGGDLHFLGDIFHDWPENKCRQLAAKSFAALAPGGRIMIHEMLYNDEKTGPLSASISSISMLLWTEGIQRSGPEHIDILSSVGFTEAETTPTFGDWSIVSARKT